MFRVKFNNPEKLIYKEEEVRGMMSGHNPPLEKVFKGRKEKRIGFNALKKYFTTLRINDSLYIEIRN